MKKILICFSIFLFLSFFKQSFAAEKLSFAANFWCPYNCHPNTKNPGYIVKILQEVYGADNIVYYEVNWARAIFETRNAVYNAIIGASSKEAAEFIYSKNPVGEQTICFYTKEDSPLKIKSMADVVKLQLGIIKNYSYFDELNAYIAEDINKKNIHVNFGDNAFNMMIKGLAANNYDVFPETNNVMNYFSSHMKVKLKKQFCHTPGKLYIAFSPLIKDSQKYANILDKGVEELINSGKMDKILEPYNVQPWYK